MAGGSIRKCYSAPLVWLSWARCLIGYPADEGQWWTRPKKREGNGERRSWQGVLLTLLESILVRRVPRERQAFSVEPVPACSARGSTGLESGITQARHAMQGSCPGDARNSPHSHGSSGVKCTPGFACPRPIMRRKTASRGWIPSPCGDIGRTAQGILQPDIASTEDTGSAVPAPRPNLTRRYWT